MPISEEVAIHTAYEARIDYEERKIRKRLHELAKKHPGSGYRRITRLQRRVEIRRIVQQPDENGVYQPRSFGAPLEAKVLGAEFQRSWNQERLHSAIGHQPPAEFAYELAPKSASLLSQNTSQLVSKNKAEVRLSTISRNCGRTHEGNRKRAMLANDPLVRI